MHFNEVPGRHCPNKFFYPWKMPPFPTFLMVLVKICPTIWEASPRLPPITDTLLHTAGVMWRPTMSSQASSTAWQSCLWHSCDILRPLLRRDNFACTFSGLFYGVTISLVTFSGLYYGVTISLVTFATGLSVVTLSLHHRGMRGTRLSPWLRSS